jgi:hypothetical protein
MDSTNKLDMALLVQYSALKRKEVGGGGSIDVGRVFSGLCCPQADKDTNPLPLRPVM